MALHKVRKGLDLPIAGAPKQVVDDAPTVTRVAVLARDYVGMRPKMLVNEGDHVALGQPLFEDRKNPGVSFTAPGTGRVQAIHRGEKRALLSVVIELDEAESEPEPLAAFRPGAGAQRDSAQALLVASGLWTALRTRPFSRVPQPGTVPRSIFVTAIDTHPLAPRPEVVLADRERDFAQGLRVLEQLTDGPVYLCRAPGSSIAPGKSGARVEEFTGKHPAGTVGYHIHALDPVHRGKVVWHIGYQDVARIGHLFETGTLDTRCVVSLAGPGVRAPRLLRTRLGASTEQLTRGELEAGDLRVVSGSVLHGDRAAGEQLGYLGRYHNQVSVVPEARQRELLGWLAPGLQKFSTIPTFLSWLMPGKRFAFDTNTHGSVRAMVPIGMYERVMPMDILPTHLLRALTVGDVEWAEELGVLELDEEDLALCTFVCPGKYDYGPALRRTLAAIEKEG
jgi:Na+-transporting NADH:ubiquinone oxidoreductase subunit A